MDTTRGIIKGLLGVHKDLAPFFQLCLPAFAEQGVVQIDYEVSLRNGASVSDHSNFLTFRNI